MFFNFPRIKTTRSLKEQMQKIIDEIQEFLESNNDCSDEELIDILHAVETAIRIKFNNRGNELKKMIKKIIYKNTARNYYTDSCY